MFGTSRCGRGALNSTLLSLKSIGIVVSLYGKIVGIVVVSQQ